MSYNIDGVEVIRCENVSISKLDLYKAYNECGDAVPETNIFDQLGVTKKSFLVDSSRIILGDRFWWSGECSGRTFDSLLKYVLPKFTGTLELVFIWEGGDSFTGVRVVDGKVTKHKVVMTLGAEDA